MDPHSQNEGLNNSWADHVYETLVTQLIRAGKDEEASHYRSERSGHDH